MKRVELLHSAEDDVRQLARELVGSKDDTCAMLALAAVGNLEALRFKLDDLALGDDDFVRSPHRTPCLAAMHAALTLLESEEPNGCECWELLQPIVAQLKAAITTYSADMPA